VPVELWALVGVTLIPGFLLELSVVVEVFWNAGVTETVTVSVITSVIWLDASDVVDETVEEVELVWLDRWPNETLCDSVVDETPEVTWALEKGSSVGLLEAVGIVIGISAVELSSFREEGESGSSIGDVRVVEFDSAVTGERWDIGTGNATKTSEFCSVVIVVDETGTAIG